MAKQIEKLSEEKIDRAASILKSLGHPMRISIIQYLEDEKELTVTQLHNLLNIEQSTTSHHLGILKEKGILGARRRGKNTFYYLKEDRLGYIIECISQCAIPYY